MCLTLGKHFLKTQIASGEIMTLKQQIQKEIRKLKKLEKQVEKLLQGLNENLSQSPKSTS